MFLLQSVSDGHVPPFEYHMCGDITPATGMTLKFSGGKLVTAGATDLPEYISVLNAAENKKDQMIPVIKVEPGLVFSTTNSAAYTAVNPGDKVTITADGLQVTATKTGGRAQVDYVGGTEIGAEIIVRFV